MQRNSCFTGAKSVENSTLKIRNRLGILKLRQIQNWRSYCCTKDINNGKHQQFS